MKIDILSLFPEMFSPLFTSMVGRAIERELLSVNLVNIRDFSTNKHKKTDDYPFGGGAGMVMMPQPLFDALDSVNGKDKRVVYMSPRGKVMDRFFLENLAASPEVVVICGHYEGVDQRVLDEYEAEEVSIGDYVLTGGELAAMVMIDAASRLVPGVLKSEESALEESIYSGLLEYPQYTQPREFRGIKVPEVLLSGNHKDIDLWRFEESLRLTADRRRDIFEKYHKKHQNLPSLTKDQEKLLEKIAKML